MPQTNGITATLVHRQLGAYDEYAEPPQADDETRNAADVAAKRVIVRPHRPTSRNAPATILLHLPPYFPMASARALHIRVLTGHQNKVGVYDRIIPSLGGGTTASESRIRLNCPRKLPDPVSEERPTIEDGMTPATALQGHIRVQIWRGNTPDKTAPTYSKVRSIKYRDMSSLGTLSENVWKKLASYNGNVMEMDFEIRSMGITTKMPLEACPLTLTPEYDVTRYARLQKPPASILQMRLPRSETVDFLDADEAGMQFDLGEGDEALNGSTSREKSGAVPAASKQGTDPATTLTSTVAIPGTGLLEKRDKSAWCTYEDHDQDDEETKPQKLSDRVSSEHPQDPTTVNTPMVPEAQFARLSVEHAIPSVQPSLASSADNTQAEATAARNETSGVHNRQQTDNDEREQVQQAQHADRHSGDDGHASSKALGVLSALSIPNKRKADEWPEEQEDAEDLNDQLREVELAEGKIKLEEKKLEIKRKIRRLKQDNWGVTSIHLVKPRG
ncbi:hypothetical protein LTS10_010566 [Elasticomyces elasticus]|nr:hypothetical protein LTS10_010566 [Elasticomyces elasticus]